VADRRGRRAPRGVFRTAGRGLVSVTTR
jgi:hypothetical protein